MPKRSSKGEDVNEAAFRVVAEATREADAPEPDADMVSAVMAAMGRKGGKKGGPARAAALSPSRRKAIAKKAAGARWAKR